MDVKNVQYNETIYEKINKCTQEVTETQDAFIFHVLSDFASMNYDITVEKEELVQAIHLIRMCKAHGPGIHERWTTATQQTAYLNDAYIRGFHDGVTEEHDRIMSILERKENQNE